MPVEVLEQAAGSLSNGTCSERKLTRLGNSLTMHLIVLLILDSQNVQFSSGVLVYKYAATVKRYHLQRTLRVIHWLEMYNETYNEEKCDSSCDSFKNL